MGHACALKPHPTSSYRTGHSTASRACPRSCDGHLPATCPHVPPKTGSVGNLIKAAGDTIRHYPALTSAILFHFLFGVDREYYTKLAIFFLKSLLKMFFNFKHPPLPPPIVSSIRRAGAAETIPYFSVGGGAEAWRRKTGVSGSRFGFRSELAWPGSRGLPEGAGWVRPRSRRGAEAPSADPHAPPAGVGGWSGPAESRASGWAPRLQRPLVSEAAGVPTEAFPAGREARGLAGVPAGRRARAGAQGGSCEEEAVRCAAARAPELGSELSPPPGIQPRRGPRGDPGPDCPCGSEPRSGPQACPGSSKRGCRGCFVELEGSLASGRRVVAAGGSPWGRGRGMGPRLWALEKPDRLRVSCGDPAGL